MTTLEENLGIKKERRLELTEINERIYMSTHTLGENVKKILILSDVSPIEKGYMLFMLGWAVSRLSG